MVPDLRNILGGWEYEPGKISVRKILGSDGCEKIQTRVDLGILQLETRGRPDGQRPFGCESMLVFLESRLREYTDRNTTDEGFVLLPEDCRDLRHEAHLYYQRFLSLFVLGEFAGVERDTARNLRVIDLCHAYGETEYDRFTLEPQRAYVTMMNARARVYHEMEAGQYDAAVSELQLGIAKLNSLEQCELDGFGDVHEGVETELRVLEQLHNELFEKMPPNAPARLEWDLRAAIDREDFEQAASLRDKLAALRR